MPNPLTFAAALTAASLSPIAKDAIAPASSPALPPTYALHLPTDGDRYFTLELRPGDDAPFKVRPDELLLHTTRNAGGITLTDNTDAIIYGGPFNPRTLAWKGHSYPMQLPTDEIDLFGLLELNSSPNAIAPTLAPDDAPSDDN